MVLLKNTYNKLNARDVTLADITTSAPKGMMSSFEIFEVFVSYISRAPFMFPFFVVLADPAAGCVPNNAPVLLEISEL